MSRQSVAPRSLTATEELEKLEQSITLTLQEIDHNFSKAHRIVTTSILPLVEQYGDHSRAVWEASKFWKQFFEASANVSLSGYEELDNDQDDTATADESTALREDASADYTEDHDTHTAAAHSPGGGTPFKGQAHDESLLDDAELSGSTPRPPATKTVQADYSNLESPYEAMKREMKNEEEQRGEATGDQDDNDESAMLREDVEQDGEEDSTVLFAQRTAKLPDMNLSMMTPGASKLASLSKDRLQSTQKAKDPLLHRVLDKNYRIQATPHKPQYRVSPLKQKTDDDVQASTTQQQQRPSWQDDSPMSSPEMAVPQLRSEAFMSPYKSNAKQRLAAATRAPPRTPGISVQTPATGRKTRDVFASGGTDAANASGKGPGYEIDWDSEDEEESDALYGGMSPPKTIQFALPASRVLQTPAGEASRRIVDDILWDAGVDSESSQYSPTMVKMNQNILDENF